MGAAEIKEFYAAEVTAGRTGGRGNTVISLLQVLFAV